MTDESDPQTPFCGERRGAGGSERGRRPGEKSGRLAALCRHFGASRYLSGDSATDYLDMDLFKKEGIEVEWQRYQHPVYPQLHGNFVPYLSVIDLLLNAGEKSAEILSSTGSHSSELS